MNKSYKLFVYCMECGEKHFVVAEDKDKADDYMNDKFEGILELPHSVAVHGVGYAYCEIGDS